MTALAPTIQAFFTDRLTNQRQASPRTIASYRDTLRLLLVFAQDHSGIAPSRLDVADIDADLIAAFLNHLEQDRNNSANTRNTRLAAVHSLFRYAALRHPEHAHTIQLVLAIPTKRRPLPDIDYLERDEADALLAAPDPATWLGRRDHALLVLVVQTGLRVSELCGLTGADLHLGTGPHVKCRGKGRKQRATPLTSHTVEALTAWTAELGPQPSEPLFPTRTGSPMSVDAVQWLVTKHTKAAVHTCPSIAAKTVSPHVLRHTCAMNLLHSGVDTATIALWLGHESIQTTQMYIHADMTLKEQALARTTPPATKPGRFVPPDPLLAFLEDL